MSEEGKRIINWDQVQELCKEPCFPQRGSGECKQEFCTIWNGLETSPQVNEFTEGQIAGYKAGCIQTLDTMIKYMEERKKNLQEVYLEQEKVNG